jgi:FkbH-like protein
VLEQVAAPGWRGFSLLRRYRADHPGSERGLGRQLRSVRLEDRTDFESRRVRYAFVTAHSSANLADPLLLECLARGVIPEQYHSTARQVSREIRDPDSGLYAFEPDVAVLASALPSTATHPTGGLTADGVEASLDSLLEDLRFFRSRSKASLVVHNFPAPEFRPLGLHDWRERAGLGEVHARVNLALAERCREIPDVHLVDVPHLIALSGARWWTLHRSSFVANLGAPEELAPLLCRDYAAVGAARRGFVRKCLVLDLDDTLWGGVVGELGPEKVQIGADYPGNIYRAIQGAARQLNERGVVLALNSLNNEDDAWGPFRQRKDMVLEPRHFAAWRINWKDKATNLLELADELQLGLSSFVMLDNDRLQQAWVEDRLPEVHVVPAQDPLDMLNALVHQRLFDGLSYTAEDVRRSQFYAAASRRREAETTAGDRESFLAGLGLVVTVQRATLAEIPRLAQLSQRTNQFNLTTRRYTEGQLQELLAAPAHEVLFCSCQDRFADDGITGMAILRPEKGGWLIDTFLLSCRILGRGVERALAAAVCRSAIARGVTSVVGEYIRTPKNGQTETFYRDLGFSPVASDDEKSTWQLTLPASADPAPAWIDLRVVVETP